MSAFLEKWTLCLGRSYIDIQVEPDGGRGPMWVRADEDDQVERIKLAAAAPQLVRALLIGGTEWHACQLDIWDPDEDGPCGACLVDAALRAAGFPTQESRDAARALIAKLTE